MNRWIILTLVPSLLPLLACEKEAAPESTNSEEGAGGSVSAAEGALSGGAPGVPNGTATNSSAETDDSRRQDSAGATAITEPSGAAPGDGAREKTDSNDAVEGGTTSASSEMALGSDGDPTAAAASGTTNSTGDGVPAENDAGAADIATGPDASSSNAESDSESQAGEAARGEWQETFPSFTRHEIADFRGGYYAAVFDVDGDGLKDVAALSSSRSELVWFKNPSWEEFNISSGTEGYICMAPYDVDGDGDQDLAIASEFSLDSSAGGGAIHWVEAPEDPTTNQEWALHEIDAVPTSHRLRWGDIDGDGTKELLNLPIFGLDASSPDYVGAVQFKAYTIPEDPTGPWQQQILDDTLLEVAHGINVVDWDGDGAEDILTASGAGVHLFQPSLELAPRLLGSGHDGDRPDRGSSEVNLGTLGGARFIATIEPWHGTDAVVYTPGRAEADAWSRHVIGTEFERGHALAVADLNQDGYDEIIGGDQGGGGALLIFRYIPDTQSWERIELDVGGVAVIGLEISDINGDGALDILAIGGSTNNLVWYENTL